jgi:HK97 family phage prohead protease
MTLEIRTAVAGELKDVDVSKRQVLVTFPHDVRDSYDTTFGSDCFRESFEKRLPAIVWQHQLTEPIGHTLSAQVTSSGNEIVGQFSRFDAVPLAHRAFSQIEDGSLKDTSFGFVRQADEKHPELRGVTRITKATMQEWSPVTIGAIPGAGVTGTRADNQNTDEEASIVPPTLTEILELQRARIITDLEARAMLASRPGLREHIIVTTEPVTPAVIPEPAGDTDDGQRAELATETHLGVTDAVRWFDQSTPEELAALPENVQQAIALTRAAQVASDDLLEVMGIADPVEARTMTTSSKPWSDFSQADYTPAQWKAACLIWAGDGDDKASGSLPVREPDGTLNTNGMSAAASAIGKVDATPDVKAMAAKKLMGLYNSTSEKMPPGLLKFATARDGDVAPVEVEATLGVFDKWKVA